MGKMKGKLIVLTALIIALAVVGTLLSKKTSQSTKAIAGTSFSYIGSIYDLKTPFNVATDGEDNVYVSNTGVSEVIIYDKDGNFISRFGNAVEEDGTPMQFYEPHGIAVDNAGGKVYICDMNRRGVAVMSKDGRFLYKLPRNLSEPAAMGTDIFSPIGVAVAGDRVYVTNKDGIFVFDNQGEFLEHWGSRGREKGQFDFPNGITTDPQSGNIYVADSNNRRIVAMTKEGQVRWMLGTPDVDGKITSVFQLPRSIALGNDGLLYISDTFNDKIVVVNQEGKLVSMFGERGTGDAQLNFPEGLTISPGNLLYFADRENNRVQIWQLAGSLPTVNQIDVDKFGKALIKG